MNTIVRLFCIVSVLYISKVKQGSSLNGGDIYRERMISSNNNRVFCTFFSYVHCTVNTCVVVGYFLLFHFFNKIAITNS